MGERTRPPTKLFVRCCWWRCLVIVVVVVGTTLPNKGCTTASSSFPDNHHHPHKTTITPNKDLAVSSSLWWTNAATTQGGGGGGGKDDNEEDDDNDDDNSSSSDWEWVVEEDPWSSTTTTATLGHPSKNNKAAESSGGSGRPPILLQSTTTTRTTKDDDDSSPNTKYIPAPQQETTTNQRRSHNNPSSYVDDSSSSSSSPAGVVVAPATTTATTKEDHRVVEQQRRAFFQQEDGSGSSSEEDGSKEEEEEEDNQEESSWTYSSRRNNYNSGKSVRRPIVQPQPQPPKSRTLSNKPLQTLERLQHMLDETDYSMTTSSSSRMIPTNHPSQRQPQPEFPPDTYDDNTTTTAQQADDDSSSSSSSSTTTNRLWTSQDRSKYKRQQRNARAMAAAAAAAAPAPAAVSPLPRPQQQPAKKTKTYPPSVVLSQAQVPPPTPPWVETSTSTIGSSSSSSTSASLSEVEDPSDTDDGLGYTLPNLPVYLSDDEGDDTTSTEGGGGGGGGAVEEEELAAASTKNPSGVYPPQQQQHHQQQQYMNPGLIPPSSTQMPPPGMYRGYPPSYTTYDGAPPPPQWIQPQPQQQHHAYPYYIPPGQMQQQQHYYVPPGPPPGAYNAQFNQHNGYYHYPPQQQQLPQQHVSGLTQQSTVSPPPQMMRSRGAQPRGSITANAHHHARKATGHPQEGPSNEEHHPPVLPISTTGVAAPTLMGPSSSTSGMTSMDFQQQQSTPRHFRWTFGAMTKMSTCLGLATALCYTAVSPRTLSYLEYNQKFYEILKVTALACLPPAVMTMLVVDPASNRLNKMVDGFAFAFTIGYALTFGIEIIVATLTRLAVFATWEPKVFDMAPAVPLVTIPWVLKDIKYLVKPITLIVQDLVTSVVVCPLMEEWIKLTIFKAIIPRGRNFQWVRKPSKSNPKRRKWVADPIVSSLPDESLQTPGSVINVNHYVSGMLAVSLGMKLADAIRRICMYTKVGDTNKGFYAFCRGIFPIHELCGTVTALGLARRDVLGQRMPLWKLLLPAAIIHGMANFRGMKPIFKWNSATPWTEMQLSPDWLLDATATRSSSTMAEMASTAFPKVMWLIILFRVAGYCIKNYYMINRQAIKRTTTYAGNHAAFSAELAAAEMLKKTNKEK